MSFDRNGLQRIGPAARGNHNLWMYNTSDDTLATIDGSGYMSAAADVLNVKDWILVTASNGQGISVVASNNYNIAENADGGGATIVDLKHTRTGTGLRGDPYVQTNTPAVVDLSNVVAVGSVNSD
ncbi:MAG TPA: hypothetical protein VKC11_00675 [Steroidobacteraceae bacterium]|nr:hypothetical protein [Steroidobacteraceae bacterium]